MAGMAGMAGKSGKSGMAGMAAWPGHSSCAFIGRALGERCTRSIDQIIPSRPKSAWRGRVQQNEPAGGQAGWTTAIRLDRFLDIRKQ